MTKFEDIPNVHQKNEKYLNSSDFKPKELHY